MLNGHSWSVDQQPEEGLCLISNSVQFGTMLVSTKTEECTRASVSRRVRIHSVRKYNMCLNII